MNDMNEMQTRPTPMSFNQLRLGLIVGRRNRTGWAWWRISWLAMALLVSSCDQPSKDLFPDKKTIGVPVGAVTHYGTGIEVARVSIDDFNAGFYVGWGATNAGDCCVLLPRRTPKESMFVTVKWKTNRHNVNESLWHEARVPINFAADPGKSGGLYIHFLPGHRVEVWVSYYGPYSPQYPGPRLEEGVSPAYKPLSGELPEPPEVVLGTQQSPTTSSNN